jgi:hypothetical protein
MKPSGLRNPLRTVQPFAGWGPGFAPAGAGSTLQLKDLAGSSDSQ